MYILELKGYSSYCFSAYGAFQVSLISISIYTGYFYENNFSKLNQNVSAECSLGCKYFQHKLGNYHSADQLGVHSKLSDLS